MHLESLQTFHALICHQMQKAHKFPTPNMPVTRQHEHLLYSVKFDLLIHL